MPFGFPNPRVMEIPVQHESSRFPQRSSTPPRVGTPPKTESPFYTLPRNHRVMPQQERAMPQQDRAMPQQDRAMPQQDRAMPQHGTAMPQQDRVREIPIQHFSSRSMSPSRVVQSHSEPNPDYPGSRGPAPTTSQSQMSQGQPQPQPSYPQYPQPQECPPGQGYPHPQKPQYPQQVYPPQHQYPSQPYPQKEQSQGYPQSQQMYSQQPQQQGYPRPNYQSTQQPYPQAQQGYPPQPMPGYQPQQSNSFQEQPRFPRPEDCPPPHHQQVVHNIPIIRDEAKAETKEGFGTWPRQPKESRPTVIPNETEYRQSTEPVSHTGTNKYHNQNQSANDQTDSGRPDIERENKIDNSSKKEPPKQSLPKTPLDLIAEVANGCRELEDRVMNFKGTKADKEYKFLEEMLTRSILKLDGVESGDNDSIRQARKKTVREIQSFLDQLELKAFSQDIEGSKGVESMDVSGADNTSNNAQSMETSQISRQGSSGNTRTDGKDDTKVKEMFLDSEIAC